MVSDLVGSPLVRIAPSDRFDPFFPNPRRALRDVDNRDLEIRTMRPHRHGSVLQVEKKLRDGIVQDEVEVSGTSRPRWVDAIDHRAGRDPHIRCVVRGAWLAARDRLPAPPAVVFVS